MKIRKTTPKDDLDAIGNIYCCSWKTAYRGIVPQDYLDALDKKQWSSALANSSYDTYIVLDGKKYAGTSSICAARDEKMAGWGEIASIYFLPEYLGKGYAKPLFEHAVNALANQGFTKIYLWTLIENIRAQKFYEKCGFKKNGDAISITIGGKELTEVRYIKQINGLF